MVSQMLQNSTTWTFIFNNLYLCSTTYLYIQHFIFIFNDTPFLSTSTQIIFIQQQYLFNFNQKYFHSTTIFVQLQPQLFLFNNKVPGHSKYRHSTKFPVPPPELPRTLSQIPSVLGTQNTLKRKTDASEIIHNSAQNPFIFLRRFVSIN